MRRPGNAIRRRLTFVELALPSARLLAPLTPWFTSNHDL